MAAFRVREWLARVADCDVERLTVAEVSADGRDALIALDGELFAQVHLLGEPGVNSAAKRGLVAAWADGSANTIVPRQSTVEW